MGIEIITNNISRPVFTGDFLNGKAYDEYKDVFDDLENRMFFDYKGYSYVVDDFVPTGGPEFSDWDGILNETYFSGILIKFTEDGDVIVGRYYVR